MDTDGLMDMTQRTDGHRRTVGHRGTDGVDGRVEKKDSGIGV